jgi:hypothetical protein
MNDDIKWVLCIAGVFVLGFLSLGYGLSEMYNPNGIRGFIFLFLWFLSLKLLIYSERYEEYYKTTAGEQQQQQQKGGMRR